MVMHIMEHRVPRLNKTLIIWLVLVGWACGQPDDLKHSVITIPEIYLEEGNGELNMDLQGKLNLSGKPYSGFLITKYSNGLIESKIGYYDGLMQGPHIKFFPSGDTAILRYYHLGEKQGMHQAWYENHQLRFQYFFDKGLSVGNHKSWYENGNLCMDMNYVEGQELGSQKMFRSDGKFRSNYVVRENGRKYGLVGLKRCAKIDGDTGDFDPYKSTE